MEIQIMLFAGLRDNRFKIEKCQFPTSYLISDVLKELHISINEIAYIQVNGRIASIDHKLKDMDILSLFPPIGGG